MRNGSSAKLYLDKTLETSIGSLTASFQAGDVGRFTIGNGNGSNSIQFARMKFYGLLVYNKALTTDETIKMNTYLMNKFKI